MAQYVQNTSQNAPQTVQKSIPGGSPEAISEITANLHLLGSLWEPTWTPWGSQWAPRVATKCIKNDPKGTQDRDRRKHRKKDIPGTPPNLEEEVFAREGMQSPLWPPTPKKCPKREAKASQMDPKGDQRAQKAPPGGVEEATENGAANRAPTGAPKKTVLAREREARSKEERCRTYTPARVEPYPSTCKTAPQYV